MSITRAKRLTGILFAAGAFALALAWTGVGVVAQEVAGAKGQGSDMTAEGMAAEASPVAPLVKDYRGVAIGMSTDEARGALGGSDAVKNKQDVFLVSDDEMAQLFFDKKGKLEAISVTYLPKSNAPAAAAVLGTDVPPGGDGRTYKLIRYPAAGYWISYNRTAGDSPVVTVTMKRMIMEP